MSMSILKCMDISRYWISCIGREAESEIGENGKVIGGDSWLLQAR